MIVSKETLVEEIQNIADEEIEAVMDYDDSWDGRYAKKENGEFNKRLDTLFKDYIVLKKQ